MVGEPSSGLMCPEKDANKTHLDKKGYVVDAISFCFVAKVPREMTAVSRTTKYTTAMMQWNKREHPFRFDDVGPSILNRELLYLCLVNRNVSCLVHNPPPPAGG